MPSSVFRLSALLSLGRCSLQPLSESEDGIFAQVQVATLPFHKNWAHLKKEPERFWIEVGMNNWDLAIHYGDFVDGDFVLGFEPLLDKYGESLAGYKPTATAGLGKMRALGRQHERGLAFPFAVGCQGMAEFRVTKEDACSTLLPLAEDAYPDVKHPFSEDFKGDCATALEVRRVPCISLEHVIRNWLGGREVFFLKVDAEGTDLAVVKSAGGMLRKIRQIQVEVEANCEGVPPHFLNSPNCTQMLSFMYKAGYRCIAEYRGEMVDCGRGLSNSICQLCDASVPLFNLLFTRKPV